MDRRAIRDALQEIGKDAKPIEPSEKTVLIWDARTQRGIDPLQIARKDA